MNSITLSSCKLLIEKKLDWGSSNAWSTQEFEELSFLIHERTGRAISATTLKRIWGRITYRSKPSRYSLDTLALFLAYSSWDDFSASIASDHLEEQLAYPKSSAANPKKRPVSLLARWPIVVLALLIGLLVLWVSTAKDNWRGALIGRSSTEFRALPLDRHFPQRIAFSYDVSSQRGDSLFIQPTYDRRSKTLISSDEQELVIAYHYPGYYLANLLSDNSVIKETPVHITTDGWQSLLEIKRHPLPIYIPDSALVQDSMLSVDKAWLDENNFDLESGLYVSAYYNVRDFGTLSTDNFSLETAVRNENPFSPCRGGMLEIQGEHGRIRIPFGLTRCVEGMFLIAGELRHEAPQYDLSAFTGDYSSWRHVQIQVEQRHLRVKIDNKKPYELLYKKNLGQVRGIWFKFAGHGSVDYVRVTDDHDRLIIEDLF